MSRSTTRAWWAPEPPHVDLAIFETADPARIAATVDAFCREHLGSGIAGALFCGRASAGSSAHSLGRGHAIVTASSCVRSSA
ncbi:MAG: hypothetical protein KF773_19250 [Deltaproteobacteria bacterium]|nr:hypothetical protein [Deltaproteobacteria bacterium]